MVSGKNHVGGSTRPSGATAIPISATRRRRGRMVLAAAAAALWTGGISEVSVRADTYNFTSGNGVSYGDPGNWQNITNTSGPSQIPSDGDIAQVVNGNLVYVGGSADALANPTYGAAEVWAGNVYGASNYGQIVQQGGTFNIGGWLAVGRNGAAGEYDLQAGIINASGSQIQLDGTANQADSAVMQVNGTSVLNALGAGNPYDYSSDGSLAVGEGGGGHLYLTDSATINAAKSVYIGVDGGALGQLDMSGTSRLNVGSGIYVGSHGGSGVLNVTGGTVASDGLYIGTNNSANAASAGTVNLANAVFNSSNDIVAGFAGNGTVGTLNVSNATINLGVAGLRWLIVGDYDKSQGIVNIGAGSNVNLLNGSCIRFSTGGYTAASTGGTGGNVVNQIGGNVTFYSDAGTTVGGAGVLDLENNTTNLGTVNDTYNLSGGTLTVPKIISSNTAGNRVFNFNGGTLRAAGSNAAYFAAGTATSANVLSGGAIVDTAGSAITIGQALGTGVTGGADGGLSVLTSGISGGALTLTGTNTYTGPTTIAAGATLQLGDGTSGNDGVLTATSGVANAGTLVFNRYDAKTAPYAISGQGAVTKLGAGTQFLSGTNSYSGATTVTAGTLALIGSGSINGTSGISVGGGGRFLQLSSVASSRAVSLASGATLDGTGTVGATTVAAGGTVANGNGSTGTLSLASLNYLGSAADNLNVAGTANVGLNVLGAMNFAAAGPVTLNLLANGGKFSTGTYQLIGFGSSNVLTNSTVNTYFAVGTGLTGRQTGTLSVAGGFVDLTVSGSSGSGIDRWSGVVNNGWDGSTNNWTDATYGGAISFVTGDSVLFDNAGANTAPVNIAAAVVPASVTFNNSGATPYTISSSGGFGIGNYSANTTLTVNGTGTVTINSSNTYAGGTFVNAGTLVANGTGALGAGPVNLIGGQLQVGDPAGLGSGPLNFSGGSINTASGSAVTVSTNNAINFNGNLTFGGGAALNLGAGPVALNVTPTITLNGTAPLTIGGVVSGTNGLILNGGGSQLVMAGASTFTGNVTVNGGLYNASNGANTGIRTASPFGNATTAGRTVTINSGGVVALTQGNTLGGGGSTTAPALAFVVNQGGVLETAVGTVSGAPGAGDANIFGNITLNGGAFNTGNGYSAAYPAALFLGTVNVTAPSTIGTIATNTVGNGISLAAAGTTFNVSATSTIGPDLNVTAPFVNAGGGGAGTLIKAGAGTMQLSGSNTYTGSTTVSAGLLSVTGSTSTGTVQVAGGNMNVSPGAVVNVTGAASSNVGSLATNGTLNVLGGTVTTTGELRVGGSNANGTLTGTGYVNVSGGTVTLASLTAGRGNNYQNAESGYVTVTGGTVTSVNDVILGYAGTGTGGLTVNGGTFNVGTAATKWLMVGYYDTAQGALTVTSGNLNLNAASCIRMDRGGTAGANVVNQTGGNVTFYSDNATTVGGAGVLDLQYASSAAANDTYNLYGGTLTVPQVVASATNGTRAFNFSGGTLRAAGNSAAFFAAGTASAANVQAGGAVIDSNGYSVTVGQVLQHDPSLGGTADGGLTKVGSGTLRMAGDSTYTGGTRVNAGTLQATGYVSALGTGTTTVANGGTLAGFNATGGPVVVASGGKITAGSGASTSDSIGELDTGLYNASNAAFIGNGTLTLNAGGTYVAKVSSIAAAGDATNTASGVAGTANDLLEISGLSMTGPFTVSLLAVNGSSPTFTATNAARTTAPVPGSYVVLINDAGAGSPLASQSVLSQFQLTTNGIGTANQGDQIVLSTFADPVAGGYDLIAEDVTAATPEPASLLLAGMSAAPLLLGRRRRRGAPHATFGTRA